MWSLLNFFEEPATGGTTGGGAPEWIMWVIIAVVIVAFVVYMIISGRKNKKRQEEMNAKVVVGATVTTIGGIVGEIIRMDDKCIWIATGEGDNKTTMQFVRQAIHSVGIAAQQQPQQKNAEGEDKDEIDEIK